jgi:hypothetical protein
MPFFGRKQNIGMKPRKIILAMMAALAIATSVSAGNTLKTISAADPRITYIGRTLTEDGNVSFDWTGVYTRIKFTGSYLSLKASDTKKNYYNVWIDSDMTCAPDKIIATAGTDTTIVIFSKEEMKARLGKDRKTAQAPHCVILQKRTEGEQGKTTFQEFSTDGLFLQADPAKERVIEFIGDSYTCGYGSENSVATDPFKPETENQNKTYACITARYFDAEQIVIAHSGMGIARNYNGNVPATTMTDLYLQTFDRDPEYRWDASACPLKPAITVIYLGTNDFSRGLQPSERLFVKNYITLIKSIKANYGEDHPVLCVAPRNDVIMFEYVRKAAETCGMPKVYSMALTTKIHNDDSDLGASSHPNYTGHLKKAYAIIPYISTITGWDMADNEIK